MGCIVLIVLQLLLPHPAALADQEKEPAGYRELIRDAIAEYDLQNYVEARALFGRAHELYPNARTLRSLGLVSFELRHYVEAVDYLEKALASDRRRLDAKIRGETMRVLERARAYVATIDLSVKPEHASVSLDGSPLKLGAGGRTQTEAGDHILEIEAPGLSPVQRKLSLRGGDVHRIEIELQRPTVVSTADTNAADLFENGVREADAGRHVAAVIALEEALEHEQELGAERTREAKRVLDDARARIGKVALRLRPSDAKLTLDGEPHTVSVAQSLVVMPGSHVLTAAAIGHATETRRFTIAAGELSSMELELEPLDTRESSRWYRNGWVWTGITLAAAGAVLGGLVLGGVLGGKDYPYAGTTGRTLRVGR